MRKDQVILVNLSGRGDKDLNTVIKEMDGKLSLMRIYEPH